MADINISFLDVGQGDGTYIETNGKKILVDLGSNKNMEETWEQNTKFFTDLKGFKNGVHIDYLVLTHGDIDHYNLIPKFNEQFNPEYGEIIFGGIPEDYYVNSNLACPKCAPKKANISAKTLYLSLLTQPTVLSCPKDGCSGNVIINPGQFKPPKFDFWLHTMIQNGKAKPLDKYTFNDQAAFNIGPGSYMEILAANASAGNDTNPNCIVLRLRNERCSVILAADATYETEAAILDKYPPPTLKANILKVGHHGSALTSTSSEWAAALDPEYAFISSDRTGDVDKGSGFKIPSLASIDTLLQFGNRIKENGIVEHKYISYYPTDFYGKSRAAKHFNALAGQDFQAALQHQAIPAGEFETVKKNYIEIKTEQRIFTNICTLGDGPGEDLGIRFDVTLKEDSGEITVQPSSDDLTTFAGWPVGDKNYRIPEEIGGGGGDAAIIDAPSVDDPMDED